MDVHIRDVWVEEVAIKVLWASGINLAGLYSKKPLRCVKSKSDDDYWDLSGNFNVCGPGEFNGDGHIEFASSSKDKTAAWISGVMSAMKMLKNWSR